jgi:hypothetical protein
VDELDLFRDLRGEPVAPSGKARRSASARLAAAIQREQASSSALPRRVATRRYGVLAFAAALVVAGATALFVGAPWSRSPGFLERAQAALTPPTGTVVHYKWQVTLTSTQFSCTVTHRPSEIWIDQAYPRKFRAVLGAFLGQPPLAVSSDPRRDICSRATPAEIGGDLTESPTLMFEPPDWLTYAPLQFQTPPDPVRVLREAISAGRAHHDGTTQLAGRTVERIRLDPPPRCPFASCREPSYAYVDPESFHPVQTESPYGGIAPPGQAIVQFDIVERYLTFEYLPRTPANAALADIEAQHPNLSSPYERASGGSSRR